MKYGFFDDLSREYVIQQPDTPLPWINYLGSDNFFSLISNTCGGYCFYKDAKLLRMTRYRYNNVPYDTNGHYFYIKDRDTIWNPGCSLPKHLLILMNVVMAWATAFLKAAKTKSQPIF